MIQNRRCTKPPRSTVLPLIKKHHKYNENKYQTHELDPYCIHELSYHRSPNKYSQAYTMPTFNENHRQFHPYEKKKNLGLMLKLKKFQLRSDNTNNDKNNQTNTEEVKSRVTKKRIGEASHERKLKIDPHISEINLAVKKINTRQKPPHRYKTAMLIFRDCMLLYGGLGCERNLTWARLSFQSMNWQIYHQTQDIKHINTYIPVFPIYGHTISKYRDLAIVYGGSCNDEVNETTIINTKNMQITQGARCPFRRKQHASVAIDDMIIVHGGIQAREVKSQIFVYFVLLDRWANFVNAGLPALASHKMVKGKNSKEIYMFGGLNSRYKSTNKMYKLRNINPDNLQLKCPNPRHSFCLQKTSNNHILLYGGRQDNQTDYLEQGIQKGVFNDIHIFNIDKRSWKKIQLGMNFDYCFGMASTSINGCVFIYGGSNHCMYADAGISIIWNGDERADPWDSLQGTEIEICSSKKTSYKKIL